MRLFRLGLLAAALLLTAGPALAQAEALYWSDTSSAVYRASPDGTGSVEIIPPESSFVGRAPLVASRELGALFWAHHEGREYLYRAGLDGEDPELIVDVTSGIGGVTGLVVDAPRGRLLFGQISDGGPFGLEEAPVGGGERRPVLRDTSTLSVAALAVDAVNGVVYWSRMAWWPPPPPALFRARLDGTGVEHLRQAEAYHLAVDPVRGWLYWSGDGGIFRARLDGSDPEVVLALEGARWGVQLALDEAAGVLYWTNPGESAILRSEVEALMATGGASAEVVVSMDTGRIRAIALLAGAGSAAEPTSPPRGQTFSLHPNPVGRELTVTLGGSEGEAVSVSVYTLTGQLVATREGTSGPGIMRLDLSGVAAGVYVVRVSRHSGTEHALITKG
jgi:hypothetical protein